MAPPLYDINAAEGFPRRLCFANGGFLSPHLRRVMAGAGYSLRLGLPRKGEGVVIWGASPTAWRGVALAERYGVPLLRVEDAFLRSVHPGRGGALGLFIDPVGLHFDPSAPSLLENILARDPLDNSNILARARDGLARVSGDELSKYNIHDPSAPLPPAGYVLVIDQGRGDASVRLSGADQATFDRMLTAALDENPGARVLIKGHPDAFTGRRSGHYDPARLPAGVAYLADPLPPWGLLNGAIAVYTVSSQLGYEALLAGHRPRVFGRPFYAGWGLTADEHPIPRRKRHLGALTRVQMFAASHIIAPHWHDPCLNRACSFETALNQLQADVQTWRQDRAGYTATGFRAWKRGWAQAMFGSVKPLRFGPPQAGRKVLVWGSAPAPDGVIRVEDGFLRSRGLGAALVPPLSVVTDDLGIYYDPTRPSRLETLIPAPLPAGGAARITALMERLRATGVSKYAATATLLPDLPTGTRILVPGQVEDDASIRLGTTTVSTNLALLKRTRAENPDAIIIYKPHPDVEAGLRAGRVDLADLAGLADWVADHTDPVSLITAVDQVWTMTSLLGFEALIRGKRVTTLGAPFYAGWGLTRDLGEIPARRNARVTLEQLAYATLIAYPRYYDPITARPTSAETVLERLADGKGLTQPPRLRALAKLQSLFAAHARLWR